MTDPRSSLTRTALASSRFVIVSAILACLLGIVALLDYPATEEPSVTLRTATVEAYLPGESAERLEKILARPIEEALRGQSEVKTLDTRIRQGNVLIYVTLRDTVPGGDVSFVWQRLRARLGQIASDLPAGTQGPLLNDDFGRVAVRTIAITGKGYSASDLELWAQHLRNQLQGVDGVASISLHGVRREIAYVDLKPDALRQAGTSVEDVRSALAARDAVAPSGTVTAGGTTLTLQAGDRITRSSDLAAFPVPVRGGSSVPLGSIATIRQIPQAPRKVARSSTANLPWCLAWRCRTASTS
jgi:multidrug efflux pump subunit AcrB